jgi:hypothetical protein
MPDSRDSSLKTIAGVLVEPTKTFEALARRPRWLPALVVLVGLSAVVALLTLRHEDLGSVLRESAAQSTKSVDSDNLEQVATLATRFGWIAVLFGVVVVGPITYLAVALVFWTALRLLRSPVDLRRTLSVTTHALTPWSVQALLAIFIILFQGHLSPEQVQRGTPVASNLAAFAPPNTGHAMLSFLGSVDVFSLWSLVLFSVGFIVVARASRGKSVGLVVSIWLLYLLLKTGLAAMFA